MMLRGRIKRKLTYDGQQKNDSDKGGDRTIFIFHFLPAFSFNQVQFSRPLSAVGYTFLHNSHWSYGH